MKNEKIYKENIEIVFKFVRKETNNKIYDDKKYCKNKRKTRLIFFL